MECAERVDCEKFATQIRIATIKSIQKRGFGHIGGCMSMADLVSVLYQCILNVDPNDPRNPNRDWLICSKGHAGPILYSALALKGFFPMNWLDTLNQSGTSLPSHCDRKKTPGIDMTTGSLGQGISMAAGVALGNRLDGKNNYTYCILGDGETQEGQVWEAASFAAHFKLDHLIVFVDNNHEQLDGAIAQVNNIEPIDTKFESFGWRTFNCNGHDCSSIKTAIKCSKSSTGKPCIIILDTIKGKGCSFALGKTNHHMTVSKEDANEAIFNLEKHLASLERGRYEH
ncbi:MAG: transketolase [Ruminococcaceae bacterium]|nr:transketolase [Oscillospiraceae bacterium]